MKKVIISSILVLVIILAAFSIVRVNNVKSEEYNKKIVSVNNQSKNCNKDENKDNEEELNINNVTVKYPCLKNSKNSNVNKEIKKNVEDIFSEYTDKDSKGSINYEITNESNDIVSIKYDGIISNGTSYPLNMIYGSNLDVINNKEIKLTDLLNIDEDLVETIKKADIVKIDDNKEFLDAQEKYKNSLTSDYLKNTYINFYLEDKDIVMILEVPHAIGDYLQIKLNYSKIPENVKTDKLKEITK